MLVVVHDGDIERTLQAFLDIKALRGLDVLEVDAAEGGRNTLYGLAELLGVFLVDLDVKDIDAAIDFEQQSLTLHDGLAAHGTNVAQAQDSRAVGDDGYEVALVGVTVGVVRILLNLQTRIGHAGRVSQREVCLRTISLGRLHFNLTRTPRLMIFEGCLFGYFHHNTFSFNEVFFSIRSAKVRNIGRKAKFYLDFHLRKGKIVEN